MKIHRFSVQTYYEDSDAGGVVYYANYFRFTERARSEMLRELGVDQGRLLREQGLGFVVRKTQADYRRPVVFGEKVEVLSRILSVSGAKIQFEQNICGFGNAEDIRVCTHTLVACIDLQEKRPRPIPEEVRGRFLNFLSG